MNRLVKRVGRGVSVSRRPKLCAILAGSAETPRPTIDSWLAAVLLVGSAIGIGPGAGGSETPQDSPAEEPETQSEAKRATAEPLQEEQAIGESTDTVEQTLQNSAELHPGLLGNRVAERIHLGWTNTIGWLDRKTGIRLSFDYNSLVQYASASKDIDLGSSGEFRGTARWRPWWGRDANPGFVDFQVRYRHRYSEIPPSDLGRQIGSLWPTTRGFNAVGWEVSHAYYEQYLFQQRFGFRLGQSRIDNMFDVHALRNQRLFFLNPAFSGNPAVADPAFSFVGAAMFRPAENLKVNLGLTDANSQQMPDRESQVFPLEHYYVTAQVGWRPKITAEGDTLLQAMYWDRQKSREAPAGNGFSLLAQHRRPELATLFLRYSYSTGASLASQFVAGGVGFTPWPVRKGDLLGAAGGWGRPMDNRLRDQSVVEVFYRFHLTASLEITPDIQLIIHPSLNPRHDLIAVFGARARFSF